MGIGLSHFLAMIPKNRLWVKHERITKEAILMLFIYLFDIICNKGVSTQMDFIKKILRVE